MILLGVISFLNEFLIENCLLKVGELFLMDSSTLSLTDFLALVHLKVFFCHILCKGLFEALFGLITSDDYFNCLNSVML